MFNCQKKEDKDNLPFWGILHLKKFIQLIKRQWSNQDSGFYL